MCHVTSALTNQRREFKACLTQTEQVSDDVTRKIGPLDFTENRKNWKQHIHYLNFLILQLVVTLRICPTWPNSVGYGVPRDHYIVSFQKRTQCIAVVMKGNKKFHTRTCSLQCWTVGAIFTFGRSRMFGHDKLRHSAVGRSRSRRMKFL